MSSLGPGKPLFGQAKEIVFNVYQYLAKAKTKYNLKYYNVADSTSEATGVSVRLVYKIVKEGKTLGAERQLNSTPSNKNKDRKKNSGFDAMEGIKVEAMDFITGEVFLDDHNIDLSPTHSGIKIEAVDLKNEEIFLDDHDMNLSPSDCGVKDDGFVEKSEDSSIDSNDSNIFPSCSESSADDPAPAVPGSTRKDAVAVPGLTRKDIFLLLKSQLNSGAAAAYKEIEKAMSEKLQRPFTLSDDVKCDIRRLLARLNEKWQIVSRHEAKFLNKFSEWLSVFVPFEKAIAPRRKPDAKKRKQWDPEKMKAAVAAVRGKEMSYVMATKEFGVPRSSLFQLVNNKVEDVTQAVSTNNTWM